MAATKEKPVTRAQLLGSIKTAEKALGHPPGETDSRFKRHGLYKPTLYKAEFGSFEEAVEAALGTARTAPAKGWSEYELTISRSGERISTIKAGSMDDIVNLLALVGEDEGAIVQSMKDTVVQWQETASRTGVSMKLAVQKGSIELSMSAR